MRSGSRVGDTNVKKAVLASGEEAITGDICAFLITGYGCRLLLLLPAVSVAAVAALEVAAVAAGVVELGLSYWTHPQLLRDHDVQCQNVFWVRAGHVCESRLATSRVEQTRLHHCHGRCEQDLPFYR